MEILKKKKLTFFTTKKGKENFMEQKMHPLLMFKSVPFSSCKYETMMTYIMHHDSLLQLLYLCS